MRESHVIAGLQVGCLPLAVNPAGRCNNIPFRGKDCASCVAVGRAWILMELYYVTICLTYCICTICYSGTHHLLIIT